MVSDEEDIRQSLTILFQTGFGERVMQPTYGSELPTLMFEPFDATFESYISDRIKDAILFQEPRITVNEITLDRDNANGLVNIIVDYTI